MWWHILHSCLVPWFISMAGDSKEYCLHVLSCNVCSVFLMIVVVYCLFWFNEFGGIFMEESMLY